MLLSTLLFALVPAILADKTYNAGFDDLNTTTGLPSPYKRFNYSNFQLSKNISYGNPHTAPNMIGSTNQFAMKLSSTDGQAAQFNSLYMGCSSCAGSECLAGYFPLACNVTMVAVFAGFPETRSTSTVLRYNPPADALHHPNRFLQKFEGAPLVTGSDVYLFLTDGVAATNVYFDNINYTIPTNQ